MLFRSYTPSDCFQTFPFPENWETDETLESIGKTYYEFRAALMVQNNQGLTATYNHFHDPEETEPDILKLRELHSQMDRAVLNAYGWPDIDTTCEFRLDYEDDTADNEHIEGQRQRKKPWRYRWPAATHDEVLARLLVLNQERHEAESLGGKQAQKKSSAKKSAKGKSTKKDSSKKTDPAKPPQILATNKQLSLIPPQTEQLEL